MPTYLSPGVYMEEVSAGPKPIEGVGTATAAFVGFTEKGPANTPTLVTSLQHYYRTF
jgi:phage tail sheath protein FI